MKKGFKISNEGQGFQITFSTGYTISVQFGAYHYCNSREESLETMPADHDKRRLWALSIGEQGSPNAEVAIIGPNGEFVRLGSWSDDVRGYVEPDELAQIIMAVAMMNP